MAMTLSLLSTAYEMNGFFQLSSLRSFNSFTASAVITMMSVFWDKIDK